MGAKLSGSERTRGSGTGRVGGGSGLPAGLLHWRSVRSSRCSTRKRRMSAWPDVIERAYSSVTTVVTRACATSRTILFSTSAATIRFSIDSTALAPRDRTPPPRRRSRNPTRRVKLADTLKPSEPRRSLATKPRYCRQKHRARVRRSRSPNIVVFLGGPNSPPWRKPPREGPAMAWFRRPPG